MKTPSPLQLNDQLEKLIFRHNEKLSKDVFEMMDYGRKIYPREGLDEFQDIIDSIIDATYFSEEAFDFVYNTKSYNEFIEKDDLKKILLEQDIYDKPIVVENGVHPFKVSKQRIKCFNRKYEKFSFENDYGIKLTTRLTYL